VRFHLTAIVTLAALLLYFWMATQVARTRRKTGILPPVMIGDPALERTVRAHSNTLEWLPIFLPSLWLFAFYWGDLAAALAGLVWVVGRIVYFRGYVADAPRRAPGFFIQAMAVAVLLFGALGRALFLAAAAA
jgi:glutathione S-transferase